ncbi:MAG: ATP-binding protein [Janthinobacterium lividum]
MVRSRSGSEEFGDPLDTDQALGREPDRNFASVRRAFVILLVAAVVLPLVYVVIAAIGDLRDRQRLALVVTSRVARIAEEHAIKVFDLNQSFNERVLDLLGGMTDTGIRQHERLVHERLRQIGGGYPQVASVSVFSGSGQLLASSYVFPVPTTSVRHRPVVEALANGSEFDVSSLMSGALTHHPVFTTSVPRKGADGGFNGVVSVALQVEYFSDFYKDLAGTEKSMTIGLAREDGELLVHYPFASAGSGSGVNAGAGTLAHDASMREPPPYRIIAGLLRPALGHDQPVARHATLGVDGEENIVAYRRVADYPVYVFASYPNRAIIDAWLRHVGLLAAGVFIPCLALWGVILMSLRRLTAEEKAWAAWRDEAATRRAVEAAFRQARRMQALGTLVGSVAHDFNNLLMTMSANAQVVRRRGPGSAENEVAAIERAIKNGKRLTRQLLGVARKQPHRTEIIRMQAWLPGAEPLLASALGIKVALIFKVHPDTWPFTADAAELELALMNVALNARDAMADGGKLTIEVDNLHLGEGEAFAHAGDYVRISVTDSGKGMAAGILARAFEPLFTTKPLGMGTGLGLPQVSGFCEQSGGTASIESQEARGTTVRLYLPRTVVAPAIAPCPEHDTPHPFAQAVAQQLAGAAPAYAGMDEYGTTASTVPFFSTRGAPGASGASGVSSAEGSGANVAFGAGTGALAERPEISILLVEDNPEVAAGTEALLAIMGYQTHWIDNADAAYEYLLETSAVNGGGEADDSERPFDLVLSDIHMPGKMNGIDFAMQLRTRYPVMPVILVTGYASELERAKLADIQVISKPFDVEILESMIEEMSNQRQRQSLPA